MVNCTITLGRLIPRSPMRFDIATERTVVPPGHRDLALQKLL